MKGTVCLLKSVFQPRVERPASRSAASKLGSGTTSPLGVGVVLGAVARATVDEDFIGGNSVAEESKAPAAPKPSMVPITATTPRAARDMNNLFRVMVQHSSFYAFRIVLYSNNPPMVSQ